MERDILLVTVGGFIGLTSSLLTLIAVYVLEGLRLRRRWEREDRLRLQQSRQELQEVLMATSQPEHPSEESRSDRVT